MIWPKARRGPCGTTANFVNPRLRTTHFATIAGLVSDAGLDALYVGLGRVDWNIVEALAFDDGADLVASSGAQWVDTALMEDASWTFDDGEPDDGMWTFASADGDCTAQYGQRLLDEQDGGALGDREASGELLASSLEDPDSFVPEDAVDGAFPLAMPGNDLIAMRLIERSERAVRSVTAARAFTGPLLGFTITVTCSEGDPLKALDLVLAKSAIRVVP